MGRIEKAAAIPKFTVPKSLGDNPFAENDPRRGEHQTVAAQQFKALNHTLRGIERLSTVVDDSTYMKWRRRHPEAPGTYEPELIEHWRGAGSVALIDERFSKMVFAFLPLIHGPNDLDYALQIINDLSAAMLVTLGDAQPWAVDVVEQWKRWKIRFLTRWVKEYGIPARQWVIDPWGEDRYAERRFAPVIVDLMRAYGRMFKHERQAVDACMDLACWEGLGNEECNFIDGPVDVLATLCERFEIRAIIEGRPAEVFAKIRGQIERLRLDGFGKCFASRIGGAIKKESSPQLRVSGGALALSGEEATLFDRIGEDGFRRNTNADLARMLRKDLTNALKARLDRIRAKKKLPLSNEIRRSRENH